MTPSQRKRIKEVVDSLEWSRCAFSSDFNDGLDAKALVFRVATMLEEVIVALKVLAEAPKPRRKRAPRGGGK